MAAKSKKTILEPQDEYPHQPDEAENYNESMYLNGFDIESEVGGWFRIGNRVNEGYAEMSVCIYLSDGRVGFAYAKPQITSNTEMKAGGLEISVVKPFEHLQIQYEGKVCLMADPLQMSNPREAFRNNPNVPCTVTLDVHGVSPMYGGMPVNEDGTPIVQDAAKSFAKAHYEQHTRVTGTITVGDEVIKLDGVGLRDKSWGPRYWQAISWYRWLPISFGDDFAMMLSIVGQSDQPGKPRIGGMVLEDGEYHLIRDCKIVSQWDENYYQTGMECWVATDHKEYTVTGEVISLIPLRNRRAAPDGTTLNTRITEAMTRYTCGDRQGIGMSEYLDQIVDGLPIGDDVVLAEADR